MSELDASDILGTLLESNHHQAMSGHALVVVLEVILQLYLLRLHEGEERTVTHSSAHGCVLGFVLQSNSENLLIPDVDDTVEKDYDDLNSIALFLDDAEQVAKMNRSQINIVGDLLEGF